MNLIKMKNIKKTTVQQKNFKIIVLKVKLKTRLMKNHIKK